ncbi:unnamed protein product [Timema podura]|uniref:Uncharacterized protein n=1 Tax=Timema podura TaxID=61482 RepID=A0ABN7NNH1_TIMPD|nr:unnamed protein product [Timema podura]
MDERKFTVKIELEENLDDELHQDINLKSEHRVLLLIRTVTLMEGDLPIKSEIFLNAVNDYDLQDFEHVLINSLPIKEEPNVDEIEVKYFEEAKDYVQDNIQNYEAQPTHSLDPLRIEKEPDKSPSRHFSNQCGSSLEKCKHSCGKAFLKQAEKFGAFVRSACKEEACPKLALRRAEDFKKPQKDSKKKHFRNKVKLVTSSTSSSVPSKRPLYGHLAFIDQTRRERRFKYLMPEENERYNMEGQTSQYYEYLLTGKDAKESINIILPLSILVMLFTVALNYEIELYHHCTDKKRSREERLEKKREE